MKPVIITGATGFIGRQTVPALLALGCKIIPVGRNGTVDKMPDGTVLLALAGRMPRDSNAREFVGQIESNILFHAKLLAQMPKPVSRVVYVSSIDVYGPPPGEVYDEKHATHPASIYGLSKLCSEQLLTHYCQTQNIPLLILRPSQVYGPGDSLDKVIPRFISGIKKREPVTLYGDGEDIRTYLYVADLARALALAAQSDITGIFNVSGNEQISICELVSLIEAACGARAQIAKKPRRGPVSRQKVDSHKLQTALNWRPEVSLQPGLRLTAESFKV